MNVQTTETPLLTEEPQHEARSFRPDADLLESAECFRLVIDMPGVAKDSLDIDFEDGNLTIHGRVQDQGVESDRYLLREYSYGDYYRTFRVSDKIDASRIAAECDSGLLILTLPKSEATMPRRIEVTTK